MEPVRVVGRPALERPIAHCAGDDLGDIERELAFARLDLEQLGEDALGKALTHDRVGKAIGPVHLREADGLGLDAIRHRTLLFDEHRFLVIANIMPTGNYLYSFTRYGIIQ